MSHWDDDNRAIRKQVELARPRITDCPFCGRGVGDGVGFSSGKAFDGDNHLFQVHCQCGMRGPNMPQPATAVALWNAMQFRPEATGRVIDDVLTVDSPRQLNGRKP